MKTLAESWEEFRLATLPADATFAQQVNARGCFYAGALGMLARLCERDVLEHSLRAAVEIARQQTEIGRTLAEIGRWRAEPDRIP